MKSNFGCILGILAFAVVFTLIATGLSKVGILPPDLVSRSFSEDVGSSIIIALIVVGLFFLLSSIGIIRNKDDGGIKQDKQPLPEPVKANNPDEDAEFIALSDPHYDGEPDTFDQNDEEEDDFSDLDEDAEPPRVWYVTPGVGIGNICICISTVNDVVACFGKYYTIEKREAEMDAVVYLGGLEFFYNTGDPKQIIRKIKVSTSYRAVLILKRTMIPFSELVFDGKLRDELCTGTENGWRYSKTESKWYLKANGAVYYGSTMNSNSISEVVVVMNERTVPTAF